MPKKITDDRILQDFLEGQDPPAIAHYRKVAERRIYSLLRNHLKFIQDITGNMEREHAAQKTPKDLPEFNSLANTASKVVS